MAEVGDRQTAKLKKLLNLATYLTGKGLISVRTVCEIFGVTRRQLVSLINDLMMVGLPPYAPWNYIDVSIEGNRIRITNSDWLQEPLDLTAEEAVSLKLMIGNVIRQNPGIFEAAGASLEAKLQAFLGHPADETEPPRHAGSKIRVIEQALEQSRLLEITYHDREADRTTVRLVEPAGTGDWAGVQCLVAYCRYSHKPTRFSLRRTRKVTLLNEVFEPRKNLKQMLLERIEKISKDHRGGTVTVRFGPKRARWAREQFEYARIVEEPDGGVSCVFRVFEHHSLADFIAEFLGEVKVEGRPEFRKDFHAHMKSIQDLYR